MHLNVVLETPFWLCSIGICIIVAPRVACACAHLGAVLVYMPIWGSIIAPVEVNKAER